MISREQYNEWRNSPVTLFFRKFLSDRGAMMKAAMTEEWVKNPEAFEAHQAEARGRILELQEASDVAFEVIEEFYRKDGGDGDQGAMAG